MIVAIPEADPIAEIDVRPLIASGIDPLNTVLTALERLPPAGVLLVLAPFRPAPLLALLAQRGHTVHAERVVDDSWLLEVVCGGAAEIADLRDLEPPEPLERVLTAIEALSPGQVYLARLPRLPRMLLPHLRQRHVRFAVRERSDGAAVLRVEKGR